MWQELQEQSETIWQAPRCFRLSSEKDKAELEKLFSTRKIWRFYDQTESAIKELYDSNFPEEKDLAKKSHYREFAAQYAWPWGEFVYYPWSGVLVRFPCQTEFRALRTSRNRNLITAVEQHTLFDATILIAGLSVGSNILETLVSMGIGGTFILADMDAIEPSNLNRIRAPYQHVGVHKADAIAVRMSEIDPFLRFRLLKDGLKQADVPQVLDEFTPDIIIDEMDQVQLKVLLRREAKSRKLPLLSAADNGDDTLLDIERYDTADYPLFHGLIPEEVLRQIEITTEIPRRQLGVLIGKYFVGSNHIPLRMFESLQEVGRSLPSWPQLGGAALQSGVAVAYAAKRILLGQPLREGRFVVGPDQVLNPELEKEEYKVKLAAFRRRLDEATFL